MGFEGLKDWWKNSECKLCNSHNHQSWKKGCMSCWRPISDSHYWVQNLLLLSRYCLWVDIANYWFPMHFVWSEFLAPLKNVQQYNFQEEQWFKWKFWSLKQVLGHVCILQSRQLNYWWYCAESSWMLTYMGSTLICFGRLKYSPLEAQGLSWPQNLLLSEFCWKPRSVRWSILPQPAKLRWWRRCLRK